jgi:hypothetical protein
VIGEPGPAPVASAELSSLVERSLDQLEAVPALQAALAEAPTPVRESLWDVFAGSDFLAHACTRDTTLLPSLVASGDLMRTLAPAEIASRAPVLAATAGAPLAPA